VSLLPVVPCEQCATTRYEVYATQDDRWLCRKCGLAAGAIGVYIGEAELDRWDRELEQANQRRARAHRERQERLRLEEVVREAAEERNAQAVDERRLELLRGGELEAQVAKLERALDLTLARLASSDQLVEALLAQRDGSRHLEAVAA